MLLDGRRVYRQIGKIGRSLFDNQDYVRSDQAMQSGIRARTSTSDAMVPEASVPPGPGPTLN